MFQDFALFPHLTVAGNVAFGLTGDRADKARRVAELLEKVNLSGFGPKHPHELSGGEQQRVALARALAPRPRVMLMDEPFSGLDNRLRDGIRDTTLEVLKEEGTAVLLVTHEPDEAMRMADEIALMRGGPDRAAGRALQRLQRAGGQGGGGILQRYQRDPRRFARRADRDAVRRLPDAGPCRRRPRSIS